MQNYKYLLLGLYIVLSLASCSPQETNYRFKSLELEGSNVHGFLYQKRYSKESDTKIVYSKWQGFEVSSNSELESLLKKEPNCEAIRIKFWPMDYPMNPLHKFELSEKIGDFKNLKYLEINSNSITKYPKEIEKLENLEEIYIKALQKENIEFSFSKFKNLKHLTLQHTSSFKQIPFSIFDCLALQTLKLYGFYPKENELKGIERLKHLKEIFIWDSVLKLPQEANYSFYDLETLIIGTKNDELPNYFYKNNTIRNLTLIGPDTIDFKLIMQNQKLENLNLSSQKYLKGRLDLPNLEHLSITDISANEININFKDLKSLESLVIWGCWSLEKLSTISNSNLRSVTIINNDNLENIYFDKANLNSLEEIIMRSNDKLKTKPKIINKVEVMKTRKR